MSTINLDQFKQYQKIHFIGIGGIGISALARFLKKYNHEITGSDHKESENIELLRNENINIKIGHIPENIEKNTDLVIYTIAIDPENPELKQANSLGIKTLTYPQAVGELTRSLKTISICGTHGKTTTTAMAGKVFTENSLDPNIIVGAMIPFLNHQNYRVGESDILILESCEYQNSFLNYSPEIIILNNIEYDHLDFFKSESDYLNTFEKFTNKLTRNSTLICNLDDKNIQRLIEGEREFKIITFGQNSKADYRIEGNKIHLPNKQSVELNLLIPGIHNTYNAAAVIVLSSIFNVDLEKAINSLNTFTGASRRFEIKFKKGNTTYIDDYAHHPSEIEATINSTYQKFGESAKLCIVFQPHQYSRTKMLLNDFSKTLSRANKVLIPNIYEARDSIEDKENISAEILVNSINSYNKNCAIYSHNLEETSDYIKHNQDNFDAIIIMGAGDINNIFNLI